MAVASGPGRGRVDHRGSLRQGRWRWVSGVEGGGADGGSVSRARQRPLRNGCRGGPATAAPARGSGAR
jgi:hypothetical protein